MNEPNDKAASEQFERRAKSLFDDSVEELDAAALSRLNQGRHAALESLHSGRSAAVWGRWVPLAGMAAAVLVTVMLVQTPDVATLPGDAFADFEILLEDDSLELYEELEFYSWLESTDLDAGGNAG